MSTKPAVLKQAVTRSPATPFQQEPRKSKCNKTDLDGLVISCPAVPPPPNMQKKNNHAGETPAPREPSRSAFTLVALQNTLVEGIQTITVQSPP